MNWGKFKANSIGMHVELEPPACFIGSDGRDRADMGSDWIVRMFPRVDVVSIQHTDTGHVAELGKDHIYDFRSNPMRSTGAAQHGFLVLKVQIFVRGDEVKLRPNRAPGASVAAVERITQLERETAALRAAVRPRRLTQFQKEVIIEALRGRTFKVWLGTMRHDSEAIGLWHDIDHTLRSAGLEVVPHTIWEIAEGLSISPAGGADREALKAAFAAAGIELWNANGDGAHLTRLEIIVGSKAPPPV